MLTRMRWIGVLAFAAWVAGCAAPSPTPVDRQEAAASSLIELHESLVSVRGQIGETLESLRTLAMARPDELHDAYDQYAEEADQIAQEAEAVDEIARQMRAARDEWLQGWQESHANITNPELRAMSERRRVQALERWQTVDRTLADARDSLSQFVNNVQDVKHVVGNDLTPQGVRAVAQTRTVQNAGRHGSAAERALAATIRHVEALMDVQSLDGVSAIR
jgi:hypothetical protein